MTARPVSKRHILVVDDEPLVCETVTMLLQMDGHRVACANSAPQALALFESGNFDLVITDFFMPAMTGGDLAAAIKTRAPGQPVLLLTAYAERFRSPHRALTGIDLVMDKPFALEVLRDAISTLAPGPKPGVHPV